MVREDQTSRELTFYPATAERWADLERLFGPRGASSGCWCMWWRISRKEFEQQRGAGNRAALQALIEGGVVPGILAYADGEPVGWCAIAPREQYPVLERSRVLKRVDDTPVWSVVCFFVARKFRGQGAMTALLRAAIDYARSQGATVIEGYPMEPREESVQDSSLYTGTAAVFRAVGFREVARRSETRPIMRYLI